MIALCVTLALLSTTLTAFVITMGVWLHSANADRLNAADLIDGQRKLVAEYKSKYETEFAAHTVTSIGLDNERQLRGVAEAQRNAAQAKARAYLARSLEGATEDDINAVLADLFAVHLSVVPPAGTRRSDTGPDRLVDPFADV